MSHELFHKVPAGAIETLFDDQNQPLFKRADLGKYLGIEGIRHNFKDFPSHYTRLRSDLEAGVRFSTLGRQKNPHNIFINLNGSIGMAVRSKKPEDAIFRFHETKKDDLIMATTNLFRNIINIHPFENENGRICRLILAHVLMFSISSYFNLFS